MHTPPRLAAVITELDVGGAERAFTRVATGLVARGWEVTAHPLSGRGPLADELEAGGVRVEPLDAATRFDPRILFRLAGRLRRDRPDAVLSFLFHANLVARLAVRLARSADNPLRPVVCSVRVAERRRRGYLLADRLTARSADRWVCVSRSVSRHMIANAGLPPDRVDVIRNGVDADLFAAAEPADLSGNGIPPDAPLVLFVGRLDRQKAPEVLREAFGRIAADFPAAHLVYAGDGPLAERLRGGPHADRLHLLGRRDDVPALLKRATLVALPSRWEGMPNVVLEAMAAGRPVVATAVDGTAEVVEDGRTGLLVPPDDVAALADGLSTLLRNGDLRRALATAAEAEVRARYGWEGVIAAYDALLRGGV